MSGNGGNGAAFRLTGAGRNPRLRVPGRAAARAPRRARATPDGPATTPAAAHPVVLLLLLLAATAIGPAGPTFLRAQEPVTEEQVPLASERSLDEIGPELRRTLDLFPEVRGFVAARLFRTGDGDLFLEVSARRDGRLVRERRPLTADALEAFRADLSERLAAVGRRGALSREGRGGLVLGQTLLGLGFYSWGVPYALDLEGDRARVATGLLTAGASFYLPYRLTRSIPVTDTHRNLALWGATRGILYGYLASSATAGPDEDHDRLEMAAAVAGSVAGSFAGYGLAGAAGLDEGRGTLWTTMADVGSLAGLGVSAAAGFLDETSVVREPAGGNTAPPGPVSGTRAVHPRATRLAVLAGAAGGLLAGRWLGGRSDWTVGDAFGLRSTTALGAQLLLPLVELAVESDRDRWYPAGMVAGGVAGVALGERLFRNESFSGSDGLLLNAGHVAGGLTALGLTWLAVGEDAEENDLLYSTTTALGSAAGFALTFRALSSGGGGSRPGIGGAGSGAADHGGDHGLASGGRGSGVELQLHPGGLTAAFLPRPGRELRAVAPLLTLRF